MRKGKKIGLGVIIGIVGFFVIGFTAVGLADEETKAEWAKEREETEKQELQQRLEERKLPTRAQDIEVSKLKSGFGTNKLEKSYYDNAEKLLSEYVLEYKGRDKSGKTFQDAFIDFYKCHTDKSKFTVEIMEWDSQRIKVEFDSDVNNCKYNAYLHLIYVPKSDELGYVVGQTWEEQADSLMDYLEQNP